MELLLEGKTAIIYGGGGGIGAGVARTFAREGASVLLAGRTRSKLDAVARDIKWAGGSAEVAELDALDERQWIVTSKTWSRKPVTSTSRSTSSPPEPRRGA